MGYRGNDLLSFKLHLNNPSKLAELQELEHWKARFEAADGASQGYFSRRWVARNILNVNEEEFQRMQSERPGSYPIPVPLKNLSDKKSQQVCRDLALRGVEEMFEALQHLKNWKPHKLTEEKEFNKEEFLEEIVDAFNYFMALLIVVDVDEEKLFKAYLKKDKKIRKRLDEGY